MSVRNELTDIIKPLLPKRWVVLPYVDALTEQTVPVVMVRQERIEKAPRAPRGMHLTHFKIYVLDPHQDVKTAEEALDDEVHELLFALDSAPMPGLVWTAAERGVFDGAHGYQIDLSITITKED